MPTPIPAPARVEAAGDPPKRIDEYVGGVNFGRQDVSIARMRSPGGWRDLEVRAGQAVATKRGEWVRYSTPEAGGADYIAVCLPAFSISTVHRDE